VQTLKPQLSDNGDRNISQNNMITNTSNFI